jgi:hypothetical protein
MKSIIVRAASPQAKVSTLDSPNTEQECYLLDVDRKYSRAKALSCKGIEGHSGRAQCIRNL